MNKKITLLAFLCFTTRTQYAQERSLDMNSTQLSYNIAQSHPEYIIGIEQRITDLAKAPALIGMMWKDFLEKYLPLIPNKLSKYAVVSIYTDYKANGPYLTIIGCTVSPLATAPEGRKSLTLPSASYAVFNYNGDPFNSPIVLNTWKYIWSEAFGEKRAFTVDFDKYPEFEKQNKNNMTLQTWVAVLP